jgi:hypothetical protein
MTVDRRTVVMMTALFFWVAIGISMMYGRVARSGDPTSFSVDWLRTTDNNEKPPQLQQELDQQLTRSLESILAAAFKSNQSMYCDVALKPSGRQATGVVVDFTRNLSSPIMEPTTSFYSVLAASTGYHISGGVFLSSQAFRFHTETTFLLALQPNIDYKLLVHEMDLKNRPGGVSRLLCSANFAAPNFPLSPRDNLPLCQTSTRNSVVPWDGHWVGPKFPTADGLAPMRTGWRYIPNDCILKTYTTPEIRSLITSPLSPPKSILVLGSSIDRGIFLSLLDIIVDKEFKAELGESKTGKCWGRASVQVGSLEVTYQDFRPVYINPVEENETQAIECHGEYLALGPGLYANTTIMFKTMFAEHMHWPDVIYIAGASGKLLLKLMALIPFSWDGRVVLGYGGLSGMRDIFNAQVFQESLATSKVLSETLNDTRVQFLDTDHMISAMRLQTEQVGRIGGSQHFHRFCREGDLFVCSNVTETLALFLLGVVLNPDGNTKNTWPKHTTAASGITQEPPVPRICTDCPAGLLPFHIKPVPDLTCHRGSYVTVEKVGEVWSDLCPSFCMKMPPNGTTWTQSGFVDVRKCDRNG